MEYRPFGRTGISVTNLSLSAMMYGPGANDDTDRDRAGVLRAEPDLDGAARRRPRLNPGSTQ